MAMINPTFFSRSLNKRFYGNRFLARIGENGHTHPPFCALSFHNGREYRSTDARVDTVDDPSTSDKNSLKFGPLVQ